MKVCLKLAPMRGAIAVMLSAALPLAAMGQLQEGDALTPVVAGLPRSVGLVAVSSKPAAVLSAVRGPWRRMGPIAMGMGEETLKSWGALAKEVGYEPGEAFDALTSGGLAVVVAPPEGKPGHVRIEGGTGGVAVDGGEDVHWAVLSVVKADVAARVRAKFKASPHEVIAGLPVLSVESGKFALVCRGLKEGTGSDEVLALTPMEDRAFLESIVAAVESARPRGGAVDAKGAEGTLVGTAAFARAKRTPADVLILARDSDEAAGKKAWQTGTVVACTLAEKSWTFDAVGAGEDAAKPQTQRLPAEASALFDAWGPSAGVMVAGAGLDELERTLANAMGGAAQAEIFKGSEAACVYLGPSAANVKSGTVGGGFSAWAAVRMKDRASLPASVIDSLGTGLVAGVEHGWEEAATKDVGVPVDPRTMAAMPEFALRVISVRMAPGGPVGGILAGGSGNSPVPGSVAWFMCPAPGTNGGEKDARWAAMGIEPRGDAEAVSARHKGLTGVLSSAGGAMERAWLWRGVVRPGMLVDAMPGPMGFALGFSGVSSVKEVRFESWDENGEERTRVVVEWK